jgi:hypothetical protein
VFKKLRRVVCGRTLTIKINPTFKTDGEGQAVESVNRTKKRIGLSEGWDKSVTAGKARDQAVNVKLQPSAMEG